MKRRTLIKCARNAKAFARQYHGHPKFDGYTESEVATGGTVALAIFKEYSNHKHAGRLPMPDDKLIGLQTDVGLDNLKKDEFHRAMKVCNMLLDLLEVKPNAKYPAK